MKLLTYILPADAQHKHGFFADVRIDAEKTLRILYLDEKPRFPGSLFSKRKISETLSGSILYKCALAEKYKNEKIFSDGRGLFWHHMKEILFTAANAADMPEFVIFSVSVRDISKFSDIIMSRCRVSFLTTPACADVMNDIMMEEFGVPSSASSAVRLGGKTAVIMPGGEIFSVDGAENIVNLSGKKMPHSAVTPDSVKYTLPPQLRLAADALYSPERLQTALDFFGISYDKTAVASVNSYK